MKPAPRSIQNLDKPQQLHFGRNEKTTINRHFPRSLLVLLGLPLMLALANCRVSGTVSFGPDINDACPEREVGRLIISTKDAAPVLGKENYLKATVLLLENENSTPVELKGKIRGRGNSTWEMPKKPYLLKLDEAISMMGMAEGEKWVLLANYADKTLLRNSLALCMARALELPYTPQDRFVEVILNDEYLGLYQLTNKVYEIRNRLEQEALQLAAEDGTNDAGFNDPFLVEIDERLNEEYWFISNSGIPYTFDSKTDTEQAARIQTWINQLESILANPDDPDKLKKVEKLVDISTMVDFYLLNEYSINVDAFYSSTYLYKTQTGKLTYGPAWDFDLAFSNADHCSECNSPESLRVLYQQYNWYFKNLLQEEKIVKTLQKRWIYLSRKMPEIRARLVKTAKTIEAARQRNFEKWPIQGVYVWPNHVVKESYEEELAYLLDWIDLRTRWLDENMPVIGQYQ